MAITASDKRVVRINVTDAELNNLLATQAKAAGLIDFDPDRVDLVKGQSGWEVIFDKETV